MTDHIDLTDDHDRSRIDLGGYVLGNLTLAEQQAVEAHLERCSACRDELGELEGIPVLLDLARDGAALTPTPVVGPAPSSAPSRDRSTSSRRSRVLAGAVGALAVVAALTVGILIGSSDRPDFGTPITLEAATAAKPGTSGTAAIRPTEHGTVVRLDLRGLGTDDSWYECTWSTDDGKWSAGTFRPTSDGSVRIDLTTAARAYPGWTVTIVEHAPDGTAGKPVLEASA